MISHSKTGPEGVGYMRTPPYDLCVRLIRESSITTNEAPLGYPDIQNSPHLNFRISSHTVNLRWSPCHLSDCIKDVAARTPTAPGSICVINILLRRYIGQDLRILTTERDLTKIMVEEMEFTVVEMAIRLISPPKSVKPARTTKLLLMIIRTSLEQSRKNSGSGFGMFWLGSSQKLPPAGIHLGTF